MIRFQTSVLINRPRSEVFDVVADPTSYPLWNSAVESVTPLAGEEGELYRMERQLATGRAKNLLEVEARRPGEVVVRASEGPTPFTYRYHVRGDAHATELLLDADVELDSVFRLAGPVAQRAIKHGVDANFAALKALLEDGARRREAAL